VTTNLLTRLADDLDSGFVDLFNAHRRVVYSTALRVSGRQADAEDLTAEAFLRAYRALRGYSRERLTSLEPRPWLIKILLNVWHNARRSAGRRPRSAPLEEVSEPVAPQDTSARAEQRQTQTDLARLLLRLPENQRVAVVLRHVSDLSLADIAEVLGCPEGTVKSHISRGLARLRASHPHSKGASR
jgi:RNA polymerase sigma-70 factor (ECF subfamily)